MGWLRSVRARRKGLGVDSREGNLNTGTFQQLLQEALEFLSVHRDFQGRRKVCQGQRTDAVALKSS